jgi:O-methyltransferase/methyltransferase family protein
MGSAATDSDARRRIFALAHAFRGSKALLSAAELGVFTILANGPLDAERLRRQIGIAERGARDFFDALVALGMLQRDDIGRYGNTPEADLYLDRSKPTYIGGELEHYSRYVYPHWSGLTAALISGQPQSGDRATGDYPALYARPASLEGFARGMSGGALPVAEALADRFPWADYGSFVDIGTAQGCLPVVLVQRHPHLCGAGLDLPPMRPLFDAYVRQHGSADRIRFVAGDFLVEALPKGEVLIFGRVLHNWDLATRKGLLAKAYSALPGGGAVIIYERFIDDERRTNAAALLASLNMLIMTSGGADFTAAEVIAWAGGAGFCDLRIEPLTDEHSMIIGRKS